MISFKRYGYGRDELSCTYVQVLVRIDGPSLEIRSDDHARKFVKGENHVGSPADYEVGKGVFPNEGKNLPEAILFADIREVPRRCIKTEGGKIFERMVFREYRRHALCGNTKNHCIHIDPKIQV
ncbi:MAG TPA: hypothetical protein PK765_00990 [bacterium]|nr:hypothetical protein [bacterium]